MPPINKTTPLPALIGFSSGAEVVQWPTVPAPVLPHPAAGL
jgi:hypothetical protein